MKRVADLENKKDIILRILSNHKEFAFDMNDILEEVQNEAVIGRSNLHKLLMELIGNGIERKKVGNKFFYYYVGEQ